MKKPLRIISIDGTRGSGKTSQISMLARIFKQNNIPCLVLPAGKDIPSGLSSIEKTHDFLNQNPNGIVILDGSIARMMVADLITGRPSSQVIDEYKELTHKYERLDHQYGIACFLMIMDDLGESYKRLQKKSVLTGATENSKDLEKEVDIITAMRFFNNHVASKNMVFKVVEVLPEDSILSLNRSLIRTIGESYDMPLIKKDENEW